MSNSAAHENICCFRVENQAKVGVNSSMCILSVWSDRYVLFTDHLKIKMQINGLKCPSE